GDWHAPVFCPGNSFAIGIEIKFEKWVFASDLNAIRLTCDDVASTKIQSGEGPFGGWYDGVTHTVGNKRSIEMRNNTNSARRFGSLLQALKYGLKTLVDLGISHSSQLYAFLSRTNKIGCYKGGKFIGFKFIFEPPIDGDNTAGNMIGMYCEDGDYITYDMKLSTFDLKYDAKTCPEDHAICGIRTQIQPDINGDDTALNNVDFYCCKNYYKLYNIQTSRALDSDFNGKVYTLNKNDSPHQRWEIIRRKDDNGQYYFIVKNQATGLVLDSDLAGNVYAIALNSGDFQKWFVDSKNRIINKATNRALDSSDSANTGF
ncbi:unnamed protein product, partial [Brachionus calyciflorus]